MDEDPDRPEWAPPARRRRDLSFRPESSFGSKAWVAARLGMNTETFRRYRPRLMRAGFPEPNPILGTYHKADVDAWIEGRRRLRDVDPDEGEINWDAL